MDETKPEAVSPTGQLTGMSALWNAVPAPAQNAIVILVFLAVAMSPVTVAQPEAFPLWLRLIVVTLAGLGGPLGMISAGVRK